MFIQTIFTNSNQAFLCLLFIIPAIVWYWPPSLSRKRALKRVCCYLWSRFL